MDLEENQCAVLMSIHPGYAEQLFDGSKRVEFRRRAPRNEPGWILVYATAPQKELLGLLRVRTVWQASPTKLWRQFAEVGGIARRDYSKYFKGSPVAFALEIDKALPFRRPATLNAVGEGVKPPQSFQYLPRPTLRKLLRKTSEPSWVA
jgi:predicted transcriptional regulator